MAAVLAMPNLVMHGVDEVRPKQKGPLDVALLCSKLEAYKIHQEAARARRRYKRTASGRQCVPSIGATQFSATAESSAQQTKQRIRRDPSGSSGPVPDVPLNEKKQRSQYSYAPLEINFDDGLGKAWLEKEDVIGEQKGEQKVEPIVERLRSSSGQQERVPILQHEERVSIKRHSNEYRPGDAQKRKSAVVYSGTDAPPFGSSFDGPSSWTAGQSTQRWLSLGPGIGEDILAEENGCELADPRRVKRPEYARPNWAQDSQTGDDLSTFLKFSTRKEKKVHAIDGGLKAASGDDKEKVTGQNKQKEEHLISDAVKSMKEKERAKRRANLLRYFKKS